MVFLGANEIKNAKESGQVRLMVPSSNFHIYPTWNPKRLKDDIALVRLPHAVSFNGESRAQLARWAAHSAVSSRTHPSHTIAQAAL